MHDVKELLTRNSKKKMKGEKRGFPLDQKHIYCIMNQFSFRVWQKSTNVKQMAYLCLRKSDSGEHISLQTRHSGNMQIHESAYSDYNEYIYPCFCSFVHSFNLLV